MSETPKTLQVLVIEPGKKPYEKEIEAGLESLQRAVDGYIQAVYPFEEPVALICDDDGKMKGKELNRALRDEDGEIYDIMVGTVLICGIKDGQFSSLEPEHLVYFSEKFKEPEYFAKLNGEILALKKTDFLSVLQKLNLLHVVR